MLDVVRWAFVLTRQIEQEHDQGQEQEERRSRSSSKKNYRPPHPRGREGRLFPPEQSQKTLRLLNELPAGGNKILYENFHIPRQPLLPLQKKDELEKINDNVRFGKAFGTGLKSQRDRVARGRVAVSSFTCVSCMTTPRPRAALPGRC